VWHAPGEDDVILKAEFVGLLAEVGFLRAAADEKKANIRGFLDDGG
jgi:hypothetical protein